MSGNLEDYEPVVRYSGLNTDKAVDLDSTLNVQGAAVMQSTLAVTGAITATGGVAGDVTGNVTGNVTGTITGTVANEDVTATNVITAAESGTTFFLNSATEFVSTLPAPAAGLRYKFIVKAAPSGASYTVVTNASANVIQGLVVVNGATVAGADEDTITFADTAAAVGDWAEVVSDGTNWYVSGQGGAAGAITLTQASA